MKFLIRNDDVAYDTTLEEIKRFCEICDKYGFKIMHAVTVIGEVQKITSRKFTNALIKAMPGKWIFENEKVCEYLASRNDLVAVHGLRHTHVPTLKEIRLAQIVLRGLDLYPTHFVPPFNEGKYSDYVDGLKLSKLDMKKGERLEDYLDEGTPMAPIMYLHSWRFDNKWYTFEQLEACLRRLQ